MTTIGEELINNPFLGYIRDERGIAGAPGFPWMLGLGLQNVRNRGYLLNPVII